MIPLLKDLLPTIIATGSPSILVARPEGRADTRSDQLRDVGGCFSAHDRDLVLSVAIHEPRAIRVNQMRFRSLRTTFDRSAKRPFPAEEPLS